MTLFSLFSDDSSFSCSRIITPKLSSYGLEKCSKLTRLLRSLTTLLSSVLVAKSSQMSACPSMSILNVSSQALEYADEAIFIFKC